MIQDIYATNKTQGVTNFMGGIGVNLSKKT